MTDWNKLAAHGKAEKEETLKENRDTAFKGLIVELNELLDNPELTIVDQANCADHIRAALVNFRASGAQLSLGASAVAPAPSEPANSTPDASQTASAEAARIRELETAFQEMARENGITTIIHEAGNSNRPDVKATMKAIRDKIKATKEEAVQAATTAATVLPDGMVAKTEVKKLIDSLGAIMADDTTGFHKSRVMKNSMVLPTQSYDNMVAQIKEFEKVAGA